MEDFGAEQDRARTGILDLAFTPDGQKVLSRTIDGWTIRFRGPVILEKTRPFKKLINMRPRVEFIPRSSGPAGKDDRTVFKHMVASPDGRHIAAADGNAVSLYDLQTGTFVRRSQWHEKSVTALAFSRDGRWLAADGDDRIVHIWEAATGRWSDVTLRTQGSTDVPSALARETRSWPPRDLDGKVYLWPVHEGLAERTVDLADGNPGGAGGRWEAMFSADSKTLNVKKLEGAERASSLSSWDAECVRPIQRVEGIIGASPDLGRAAVFDSGRIVIEIPSNPRAHARWGSMRPPSVPMASRAP